MDREERFARPPDTNESRLTRGVSYRLRVIINFPLVFTPEQNNRLIPGAPHLYHDPKVSPSLDLPRTFTLFHNNLCKTNLPPKPARDVKARAPRTKPITNPKTRSLGTTFNPRHISSAFARFHVVTSSGSSRPHPSHAVKSNKASPLHHPSHRQIAESLRPSPISRRQIVQTLTTSAHHT